MTDRLFVTLVAAAVVARLLAAWLLPPLLDVYYYDSQAARALLSGINPYGFSYTGIPSWLSTPGAANVFAYLPGVALFLAPFGAVWDVRLGLIFADVVVGLSIYSLRGTQSRTAALVFLLLPFTVLFSTSYPNNTLVAMASLAVATVLWTRGRGRVASVLMGVALASSQLIWFLYPLFLAWSLRSKRFDEVAIQTVSALALVLPFALWNWSAFTYDTILFEFTRAPRVLVSAAAFGFNVNPTIDGLVFSLTGVGVPLLLRAGVTVVGVAYAALRSKDLRAVLLNGTVLMILVILVLPNDLSWWYFELPFMTLLVWLAGAEGQSGEKGVNP
ncbi:MAG TPA: hypothetical protein VEC92_02630 [Nitrososphaerales archaeon]|nr:hypothetical protein [Nitrososphaerales archaeon]